MTADLVTAHSFHNPVVKMAPLTSEVTGGSCVVTASYSAVVVANPIKPVDIFCLSITYYVLRKVQVV